MLYKCRASIECTPPAKMVWVEKKNSKAEGGEEV